MKFKDEYIFNGIWKNDNISEGFLKENDNGYIYEGEIKDGKKNGKGKMTYNNQCIFNGIWKNNCMDEGDLLQNDNGNIYEGKIKEGKKMEKEL